MRPSLVMNVNVDVKTQSELDFLREELAKYKRLRLTPEQKHELGLSDVEDFSKGDWSLVDCIFQQINKFRNYKEALLGKVMDPGVAIEEVDETASMKPDTEYLASGRERKGEKYEDKIEVKSDSESTLSGSTSSQSTSRLKTHGKYETNSSHMARSDLDNDSSDNETKSRDTIDNDVEENVDGSNGSSDAEESPTLRPIDSERSHITRTESMIIALENDLSVKEAELEKLKDLHMNFRSTLQDRDMQINYLQQNLAETESQLRELIEHRNAELEEWKRKLSNGRNLIDQVNRKLEEKRQQCATQAHEIEDLKLKITDVEALQAERDALTKKLDEVTKLVIDAGSYGGGLEGMKAMIRERDELTDLKKNFELHCLDQEDEIDRLSKLIHQMQDEYENQRSELNRAMEGLKMELEEKNRQIALYQDVTSLVRQSKGMIYEKAIHRDESDGILDEALVSYFKRLKERVNELSADLKGAGDEVGRGKSAVESLQKEIQEISTDFRNQMTQRINEGKLYLGWYEQYKEKFEDEVKKNEELQRNKNSQRDADFVNDLTKTIHEKDLLVAELHKEHFNLTNEIKHLNGKLTARNERIVELEHDKDIFLHKLDSMAIEVEAKTTKINALQGENTIIAERLKENDIQVTSLLEEIESMRFKGEQIDQISFLQNEIDQSNKEKRKFRDTITSLRNDFENYRKANKKLDDNLSNILNQKETLEAKITAIKEDIARLSNDLKENVALEGDITDLPQKICSSIGIFKQRLSHCELNEYAELKLANDKKNDNTREHDEELKKRDEIIDSLKQEVQDLSSKIDEERIKHESALEKLQLHYKASLKACYEDNNRTLRKDTHFGDESVFISDNPLSPSNIKINSQLCPSKYLDRWNLERNVQDFTKEDGSTAERRNVIFLKHSNDNKSKQSYEKLRPKSANSPSKQFIRNCSRRNKNENS